MPPRERFKGDVAALYSSLKPSVVSASYLPAVSKVSGKYVEKHALALVRCLREQQANLSFTKKLVLAVHGLIFDEVFEQFGLAETARAEWSSTMSDRLRQVCRFSAQALLKNPRANWANELLGTGAKPEDSKLEQGEQEQPEEE